MSITFRQYNQPNDYQLVDDFLIRHYQPENLDNNLVEPAWEYMHGHPYLDSASLGKIGIWEDESEIVAVTHYESRLGEAFFQFHPGYRHLRQEMLEYAEGNLSGVSQKDNRKYLCAFIHHNDDEFQSLVAARGYEKKTDWNRPLAKFVIPFPFPTIMLPEGFHLTSLADECDWAKVHRALWRGFDHEGEPPMSSEELESRRKMFDTPKARRDLKIAVAAPDGNFVSFCGMFYDPLNRYAYVEPVATDPDYRRLGLGKAAVLEGIRRCGKLGATVAYVGSDQAFYLAMGFEVIYTSECWVKYIDEEHTGCK
jgi:GNAT superfamily N-acetyltransferase